MASESNKWICRSCWNTHAPDLEPEEVTIARLAPGPCAWCGVPTTDTILNPTPDRHQIPLADGQAVHVKPAEGPCAIHDWPTAGLARRLFEAMRATHPTGINACRDCLARAKEDARP